MANTYDPKKVPVEVFGSPRGQRVYDHQAEGNVAEVVRKEVLEKSKTEYGSVKVKIRRAPDGSPLYLIVYLLRSDTYTADVARINVDASYGAKEVATDYDDSEDIDEDEEDDPAPTYEAEEYTGVDVVAATCCTTIPTAVTCVQKVCDSAKKAGLNAKVLLGPAASTTNYKKYLKSGVQGFVNVGHGNRHGIVLANGTLNSSWFHSLTGDPLSPAVVYFNSCQVHNDPLKSAVMKAGARTFIGGIINLGIGTSEEVCKCFWKKALLRGDRMGPALTQCEKAKYPQTDAHGICGDEGPFFAGHLIVFKHINYRGLHRHIFGMDRNLNHPDDRSMNDQMSSFVVVSGKWKFYKHAGFRGGYSGVYGPGAYNWVGSVGLPNDQISSMRCVQS